MTRAALTVDLEADWGIKGTRAFQEITPVFLRFLERRGFRATFFVVSNLVEVDADMVAAIGERNEIASHGRTHRLLNALSEHEADEEIRRSKEQLEAAGHRVDGFRAPFFSCARGWLRRVAAAGYQYDASMGSVWPGPHNLRLGAMKCPRRRDGLWEFPTDSMCLGALPLSLTWMRLSHPFGLGLLPRRPSMLYLHLHEFLPADTASALNGPLRWILPRNCGDKAWDILARSFDKWDTQFTTCREMLESI